MSTASNIKDEIRRLPERSFVRADDFDGPSDARYAALSRCAAEGELKRIRRGLYWKGPRSRYGMVPPSPAEIAMELAGPGAGPAGISASRVFGLTTQVPSKFLMAVPGRPPEPFGEVEFVSRPARRASFGLKPLEVAAVEVLRSWPEGSEVGFETFAAAFKDRVAAGDVRPDRVEAVVGSEHSPGARDCWRTLRESTID